MNQNTHSERIIVNRNMNRSCIEPPAGLLNKILKCIHREERILVFKKVALFSITLFASIIGFIPTFKMLVSDSIQSGFLQFAPLMFSDFSTVATYWQSFTIILLETLPVLSLALFLSLLLVFLQSVKFLTRNIKIIVDNGLIAN